jgi:hypothetical protein
MSSACKAARTRLLEPHILNDQVWEEALGEGGFDLRDGHARIFALDRFGKVHIFKRIRVEEKWVAPLVGEVSSFEDMTKLTRKVLSKSPWKATYFQKVIVTVAFVDQASGQWCIKFPFKKEPKKPGAKRTFDTKILKGQIKPKAVPEHKELPTTSYFFADEFVKASELDGWITPRKQSQGRPWQNGMTVLEEVKAKKVWVPNLTSEEVTLLVKDPIENKCQVLRALNKRHNKEIQTGLLSAMDIKEGLEALMSVLK